MKWSHARLATSIAIALAMAYSAGATSKCSLEKVADWPVRLERNRIIVDGRINGRNVGIMLDTGASRSLLLRAAAERLDLTRQTTRRERMFGVGGETYVDVARVDELSIEPIVYKNQRILVAGEQDFGDDVAMLLGEDFLQRTDVEFDLAHHAVRLYQPKDCGSVSLAYWASAGAGVVDFNAIDERRPQIVLTVRINGYPVEALLDSGASLSVLDKSEAARLGVTPESPGVVAGASGVGLGKVKLESWVGPFETFTIGDETIRDTEIQFADLFKDLKYTPAGSMIPERLKELHPMLLGFDFLQSHRVLIAHSQRKIYFTYVGGPVFDRFRPPAQRGDSTPGDDARPEGKS